MYYIRPSRCITFLQLRLISTATFLLIFQGQQLFKHFRTESDAAHFCFILFLVKSDHSDFTVIWPKKKHMAVVSVSNF